MGGRDRILHRVPRAGPGRRAGTGAGEGCAAGLVCRRALARERRAGTRLMREWCGVAAKSPGRDQRGARGRGRRVRLRPARQPRAALQRPVRQLRAAGARADGDLGSVHGDGLRPRVRSRGRRAREPGAWDGEPRAGAAGGAVRLLAPRLRGVGRRPRARGQRRIPGCAVPRHGPSGHEVGRADRSARADVVDDATGFRRGAERQAGPGLRRDPGRRRCDGGGDPGLPAPARRPA